MYNFALRVSVIEEEYRFYNEQPEKLVALFIGPSLELKLALRDYIMENYFAKNRSTTILHGPNISKSDPWNQHRKTGYQPLGMEAREQDNDQ